FDVIWSAFSDKPEHHDKYDFVDYQLSNSAVLVPAGNPGSITGFKDMCGRSMLTLNGAQQVRMLESLSEECTAAGNEAIDIQETQSDSTAVLEVQQQRVDGFMTTSGFIAWTITQRPDEFEMITGSYDEIPGEGDAYHGVVIPKG